MYYQLLKKIYLCALLSAVPCATQCLYYSMQRIVKPALVQALYKYQHLNYTLDQLYPTHTHINTIREQFSYQDLRPFFFKAKTPIAILCQSMQTQFDRTDKASTILLTYTSSVQDNTTLNHDAQKLVDDAYNNFKQLSRELRAALKQDIYSKLSRVPDLSTPDITRTLAIPLQIHYAHIIRHLLENDLPYKRTTCERKCPVITFYTSQSNTHNTYSQPDILVTIIKVEEVCQRTATETLITDSNIQTLIAQKLLTAKRTLQQHAAIAQERMHLLTSGTDIYDINTIYTLLGVQETTAAGILGIRPTATHEQAKLAYFAKRLMWEKHPQSQAITQVLSQAYQAFIATIHK